MTLQPATRIVDLPPECLVNVISQLPGETLSTARLTCKALESAAFDAWAEVHLSYRNCFVMDPECVQNLKRMAMDPNLSKKVRSLELTVWPGPSYGQVDEVTIVAKQGYSHEEAQANWIGEYCRDEYHRLKGVAINQALLSSILSSLAEKNCHDIILNLVYNRQHPLDLTLSSSITHDILYALQCSASRPTLMELEDQCIIEIQKLTVPKVSDFADLAKKVHRLVYIYDGRISNTMAEPESQKGQIQLLRNAHNLTYLSITCGPKESRVDHAALTSTLLLENPFHRLESLFLVDANFVLSHFLTALKRCKQTLVCLGVEGCHLKFPKGDNAAWVALMKELHSFELLQTLQWESNWAYIASAQGWKLVLFDDREQASMKKPMDFGCIWTSSKAVKHVLNYSVRKLEGPDT